MLYSVICWLHMLLFCLITSTLASTQCQRQFKCIKTQKFVEQEYKNGISASGKETNEILFSSPMFIPLYWCITCSRHFIYPFHHNLLLRWSHLPSFSIFSLVSCLYQKQIKPHYACQFAKGVTGCPRRSRLSFSLLIKSNGSPAVLSFVRGTLLSLH